MLLEETEDGILIHAVKSGKPSWEDTYKAMADAEEQDEWADWQDLDVDEDSHL